MIYSETLSINHTILGWTGIGAVCLLFTIGQFFLFTGTKHTGSAQASLILNVEPLISIVAAIILLGEQLAMPQYIGVAVVITALFLAGDNPKRLFIRQKRLTEK
jgi:drug/metabolite transporter (DMT)-like permease